MYFCIMPKDGNKTKIRILDETTQLVLENGFAGTSIDQILERTALTKGAFFYHFANKAELALKLMEYFVEKDMQELQDSLRETEHFSENPRERLLAFVQRFINIFRELDTPYAGCLYASYVYEPEQFSQEIKDAVAAAILRWREALAGLIKQASLSTQPKTAIDPESLADLFTVILEGSFITSKALNDPKLTAHQLKHYKNYFELLFAD